jgi:tripartite-type tricarboxylate transporter receptor subunit TctC
MKTRMNRRHLITVGLALTALPTLPAMGQAVGGDVKGRLRSLRPEGFPTRPIEILVAYPPGGGMDVNARVLAKHVEKLIEQPITVVNRAGAAGVVGESYMATQVKPDGYTVGLMASNFWSNSMLKSEGKWSYRDTEPIAFVNSDPPSWLVSADGRWKGKGLREVLAEAKANPGTVRVAASSSTATAFIVDQLEAGTGAKFVPVLYQGDRQAMTDLLGGHIDVSYAYYAGARPMVESGKAVVIGVASAERMPLMPNAPTFNEVAGTDDIIWDAFRFVVVPKGMDPNRKRWLEAVFNAALSEPEIAAEFAALGAAVNRSLDAAAKVAQEVERRATRERAFYVRTGRLK